MAIYTRQLSIKKQVALAIQFWDAVAKQIPDWGAVYRKEALSSEVRQEALHAQAISLVAMGKVGSYLLSRYPKDWEAKLTPLNELDWSRTNPAWQGQVIFDGVIKKNRRTIDAIQHVLMVQLEPSKPIT